MLKMSGWELFKCCVFLGWVLGLLQVGLSDESPTQVQADRPNILWVTSEDNSHFWLGCYGNEQARTPHLDQLAKEGVRYRYAYANAPVCAVARCTLITGRYACGMGTQNMRSRYPIPSEFRTYVSYLREAGYYCVNRSKTDYNFRTNDKSHWDACDGNAHWKNRQPGQPFFAVFNTTISHESSLFAKKTNKYRADGRIPATPRLAPESVTLPPYLPDTPEIRQDWVTYHDVITAMDAQIGNWISELEGAGELDNTIVFYYADHGGILPRGKRYIYDTGTHVPMIVRFPPKWSHWAPGAAGSTSERPVSFIDLPPTALSLAGIDVPAQMQGRAFLGDAQQPAEPFVFLFGQRFDSRMLRFVRAVTNGRYRYIRNFHPHRHRGILAGYPHGQVGWQSFLQLQQAGKTDDLQSAFWQRPQPVEELYDTQADPWEVKNLAADPQYQEQMAVMRSALINKMQEIGDTGVVPEAMYPSLSANSTIYDYVHDQNFAYNEILDLSLLATAGDPSGIPQLQTALASEHPVKRYWGALGCTILGEASRGLADDLTSLLDDDVAAVRIAAAEALVTLGERAVGRNCLEQILRTTNDDMVALETLNVVAALGITKSIPAHVYARACGLGSYPARMADDR